MIKFLFSYKKMGKTGTTAIFSFHAHRDGLSVWQCVLDDVVKLLRATLPKF